MYLFQNVWKIKRCGEDIRLVGETITANTDITSKHVSATWAFPQFLYILTKTGAIHRVRFLTVDTVEKNLLVNYTRAY